MKKNIACTLFILVCFCSNYSHSLAQTISGVVKDKKTNETLVGANALIKGTTTGAVTDIDGKFQINYDKGFPVTIIISYVGYVIEEVIVKNETPVTIKLSSSEVKLKGVDIAGSRISEKQKESPLTVEAMDIIAIKETPSASFYEGLGQLKGVDLTSASIGFKVINTRGFNSTSPVRSLQIIDGVDNQSPGLNFSLGNFVGCAELDVQKVDLVVGASSAYYGPNAFNGVISMTTRSPFVKPGLDVSYKVGERGLVETGFRWAEFFKNKDGKPKFGYKLNMCFMQAQDWEANNLAATPQSKNAEDNPGGYDAVNSYGDEFSSAGDYSLSARNYPGLGTFYRTGYLEKDLVDYNTKNVKVGTAFYYKLKPETELILSSNFGTGTTVYQGDNRYSLKDILFFQNKIEIKKENKFFLRAYATNENAGNSYDAFFTALLLQDAVKADVRWYTDYGTYWNVNYKNKIRNFPGYPQLPPNPTPEEFQAYANSINPFLYSNYLDSIILFQQITQAFADSGGYLQTGGFPFLQPGTYAFDTTFARITSTKSSEGGSKFFDKSALYHVHGEYKFTPKWMDITVGSNYRVYTPNSQGTIFSDTSYFKYNIDPVTQDTISSEKLYRKITNREYGIYAGIEKKIFDDKLKFNATCRMDKNENFDYLFSPATSVVYNYDKNNLVRLSFSSAIRNPTLTDQYLYYNVGRATLIGNINGFDSLVTIPSLFRGLSYQNPDTLEYFNVAPVRPEQVRTAEVGYRGTFFNHLYADISYYYSVYTYFIGYKLGAQINILPVTNGINVQKVYRVATNSLDKVYTQGVSLGLSYFFWNNYAFTGNYSWNKLDRKGSTDPLIPAYNTPEHKFNIGMNGREIKNWGFSVNYKWIDGFLFEGSPQFTGAIKTYNMIDFQINRKIPSMYTTFKLGANNILDNQHYEVYGGPLVGRLIYFSILLELENK